MNSRINRITRITINRITKITRITRAVRAASPATTAGTPRGGGRTALPLAILPVVLALSACALGGGGGHLENGRFRDQTVAYAVGAPGPGWKELTLRTANVAWFNDALQASLLVNSHCEGVGDSSLEGLTNDLLMGMTERQILSQARLPSSRREALESIATAKLDGVPRKLTLFVLKKDSCVYDIVLDASPATFDAARPAYEQVRDGFHVDARQDRG